jgi:hypothetical protein
MDELDRYRSFRRTVRGPSEGITERAHRAVAQAAVRERAGLTGRPRGRRGFPTTVTLVAVALAAAVALVLIAPWSHGPAAISPANAALILHKTVAAIKPRSGWVLHERNEWFELVPGTGYKRHGTTELWIESKPPYRYRYLSDLPALSTPVETGGSASTGHGYAYDPHTSTLYSQSLRGVFAAPNSPDATKGLHNLIAQETAAGKAKITGRTRIDGQSVYEIALALAQLPITLYVNTTTYAPVRIVWPGLRPLDGHWFSSAQYTLVYEYLPPTPANLRLTNIQHSHPAAAIEPASKMPQTFRSQLYPPPHGAGR